MWNRTIKQNGIPYKKMAANPPGGFARLQPTVDPAPFLWLFVSEVLAAYDSRLETFLREKGLMEAS